MRRHGSSQSGCSNISLLDEITDSLHTCPVGQGTVSSLPLPVPELDAESNIDDERYLHNVHEIIPAYFINCTYKFRKFSFILFYLPSTY